MATVDATAAVLAAVGPLGLALDVLAREYVKRSGCEVLPFDVAIDELIPDDGWTFPWTGDKPWTIGITKCGELFGFGHDVEVAMVISALVEAGIWREVEGMGFALENMGTPA